MTKVSTSRYYTFLGGNLVRWKIKNHNIVKRSSAESEFRAIELGFCELMWIKIILKDQKVVEERPMKYYCDNKLAIDIANNLAQHD